MSLLDTLARNAFSHYDPLRKVVPVLNKGSNEYLNQEVAVVKPVCAHVAETACVAETALLQEGSDGY